MSTNHNLSQEKGELQGFNIAPFAFSRAVGPSESPCLHSDPAPLLVCLPSLRTLLYALDNRRVHPNSLVSRYHRTPAPLRLNTGLCVCVCVCERERERLAVTAPSLVAMVTGESNNEICLCEAEKH